MSDESYKVPVEGDPCGQVEVPVTVGEHDSEIRDRLNNAFEPIYTKDPLAGLPADVKQEALAAKIAALESGKTVKEADKAQRSVVSEYLWDGRIAAARKFFKWCWLAAALSGIYWLAAHDWLSPKYHPARADMERAVKVAKAQYRVDVARIDLQDAKK